MAPPKPIVVAPSGTHTATMIVAHGLGDSGLGWVFLAEEWSKKFDYIKFIFPNAPSIPITINMGMSMPGWYDITSLNDVNRSEDDEGIAKSRNYFHSLIAEEVKAGISADRVVVGGFSQGGAMSLHASLTAPSKLAGIFGLSCYMLLRDKTKAMITDAGDMNKETKIFMGHGDADPVVQYQFGKMTADLLKEWGYSVDFRTYPNTPHTATPKEIDHLEQWVKSVLPPTVSTASTGQGNL